MDSTADPTIAGRVVDVRHTPLNLGKASPDEQAATEAVCDRVLRKAGAKIPAAYFQSAL